MSLYGNRCSIGGVSCGMVLRGAANGEYRAVFEREFASLEDIEGIRWDRPQIQGACILPAGYGFTVRDIQYSAATRSYTVVLQVAEQYLGDVAGYQSQMAELEENLAQKDRTLEETAASLAEKESAIARKQETIDRQEEALAKLEAAGTAAQVDAQLKAAYQEGVEQNG